MLRGSGNKKMIKKKSHFPKLKHGKVPADTGLTVLDCRKRKRRH